MSLDVSLVMESTVIRPASSGIFIRENGKTIEISEEEWYRRNPNRKPVRFTGKRDETNEIYSDNITHNLTKMAGKADLYTALWRPDEHGWTKAKDIIGMLERGLKRLKKDPEGFKKYNPENGWGSYDGLVEFVENYLAACKKWPEATIEVSR